MVQFIKKIQKKGKKSERANNITGLEKRAEEREIEKAKENERG